MDIQYGTTKVTRTLDNEGSTETILENVHDHEIVRPVRKYYEIKLKVFSPQEERDAYTVFSENLASDKTMIDPAFKIERSKVGNEKGFYYVTKCYTILEY